MLQTAPLSASPAARSFLEIWVNRYRLDALPILTACTGDDLKAAITREGRQRTATHARRRLRASSEFAALKTNGLFSYVPNLVNLEEVGKIAALIEQIYAKLIDIYQQQQISPAWLALIKSLNDSNSAIEIWEQASTIQLFSVEQIAKEIEPLILSLQEQHLACQDRRTIGFMSTQFHFSTEVLLSRLAPVEQVLLKPYFRFVEEQVCIPWQRICTAATHYPMDSPTVATVQKFLSHSQSIEDFTSKQITAQFPEHRSRRGFLNQPQVAASSARDINMFQAYLALCVLENSLSSIDHELLPLCIMVFPSISVDWEVVEAGIQAISQGVTQHLSAEEAEVIAPYAQAMTERFVQAKSNPLYLEINQLVA